MTKTRILTRTVLGLAAGAMAVLALAGPGDQQSDDTHWGLARQSADTHWGRSPLAGDDDTHWGRTPLAGQGGQQSDDTHWGLAGEPDGLGL
ncbi:hypothetical protein [Kitasatospora sp. NPDC089509]|uniref:hypothetical protein n=1 Tax=Kitasatospora sp. NPDC089509 TaxID=3364079 RepID=UPI00381D3839